MKNEFVDIMAKQSDTRLIEIINSTEDEYQPAALEAARNELNKRNLSADEIISAKNYIKERNDTETSNANAPLGIGWKIISFIIPGFAPLIKFGFFKAGGYHRKAKEVLKWTFYGFTFYMAIIILVSISF